MIQRVTVMGDRVEGAVAPKWSAWTRQGRLSATSRYDRQLYMFLSGREQPDEQAG